MRAWGSFRPPRKRVQQKKTVAFHPSPLTSMIALTNYHFHTRFLLKKGIARSTSTDVSIYSHILTSLLQDLRSNSDSNDLLMDIQNRFIYPVRYTALCKVTCIASGYWFQQYHNQMNIVNQISSFKCLGFKSLTIYIIDNTIMTLLSTYEKQRTEFKLLQLQKIAGNNVIFIF